MNSDSLALVSLILTVLGLFLVVWARLNLGRNWSMVRTQKKDAKLVTSGPYRLIRHPIYAGIIVSLLGVTLTMGINWIIFWAVMVVFFVNSAYVEEKSMVTRFPKDYLNYKTRTKMLIPFIF